MTRTINNNRKNVFLLLLFGFIIIKFSFLPFSFLPVFRSAFLPYIVGIVASFYAAYSFVRTKKFLCMLCYIIAMIFNYIIGDDVNIGNILSESFTIWATAFLSYYLLEKSNQNYLSVFIIYFFLIITLIYTVQTFRFYQINSGIVRHAAMKRNFDAAFGMFVRGLVPYQFPHALSCVIPAFVLGIKINGQSLWKKLLCWISLGASLVLVYITQSSGALLVAIMSILGAFVIKVGYVKKNIRRLFIILLLISPIAISDTIQLSVIRGLGSIVGTELHYQDKLEELEGSIIGSEDEGDIAYRGSLLGETVGAIIKHPIFGVSDHSYGEHNALLDRWAEFGLIGFLPLIIFIFYMVKSTALRIPYNIRIFYYWGVSMNLLMMLSKSMFGWHQWFCFLVVLPLMVLFFGQSERNGYVQEI